MMYQILSLFATPVLADDYGLEATAKAAALTQFGGNLPTLIGSVLGTALSLVGVLFFALMLFGGITWMMAHGNAESEKKALGTITAAIIGILIVLGSYALTSFVLSSVKSAGKVDKTSPPSQSCQVPSDLCKDCSKQADGSCGGDKCFFASLCEVSDEKCGPNTDAATDAKALCDGKKDAPACATAHCEWK